jgi:CHAD domain-containing protein
MNGVFQKTFQEKGTIAKKRLREYIEEQREEQIHNLRTSIRRLESAYLVFPKSCKRKKTDVFVSSYKSLFRKNSIIRDLDVIYEKLDAELSKNSDVLQFLVKHKEKKLSNILKDAKKLSKLKIPKIKEISDTKILQKYERTISSLIDKMQKYIPVVASDESQIDELHSLRKTAKKLRYVLELDPDNSYHHTIVSMRTFQRFLGEIHDCDISIDFLKAYSNKFPELQSLILKEQNTRTQIYKRLAISLSDSKI